jgi:hypothetical protein
MPSTIVYAHGFKSAAQSRKATQLGRYIREHTPDVHYIAPNLHFDPDAALAQLSHACAGVSAADLTIVGSSLGGFYAVVLAEKLGCRAVLLNPSIRPFVTLEKYLGLQTNIYTGETFTFSREHIATLREMFVPRVSNVARYLLIVETGDEVLDYRDAVSYHQGAAQIIVEGGDHELRSFPQHIAALLRFVGLAT